MYDATKYDHFESIEECYKNFCLWLAVAKKVVFHIFMMVKSFLSDRNYILLEAVLITVRFENFGTYLSINCGENT